MGVFANAVRLTKPVLKAIEEKWPLFWAWHEADFLAARTAPTGYALYAETGHHENGARIERRLWCHPNEERARQLSSLVELKTGATGLGKNIERVIARRLYGY